MTRQNQRLKIWSISTVQFPTDPAPSHPALDTKAMALPAPHTPRGPGVHRGVRPALSVGAGSVCQRGFRCNNTLILIQAQTPSPKAGVEVGWPPLNLCLLPPPAPPKKSRGGGGKRQRFKGGHPKQTCCREYQLSEGTATATLLKITIFSFDKPTIYFLGYFHHS